MKREWEEMTPLRRQEIEDSEKRKAQLQADNVALPDNMQKKVKLEYKKPSSLIEAILAHTGRRTKINPKLEDDAEMDGEVIDDLLTEMER